MVPCCDSDVTITQRQILRGILHQKETKGLVMVGCPNCHTALYMPTDMPTDTPLFVAWINEHKDDPNWLPCVPFLDNRVLAEPAGAIIIGGRTMYRSGAGTPLLTRYEYMVQYGIDAEGAYKGNPSLGGQPRKVGR